MKRKGRATAMPVGILIGVAVAMAITIGGAMLLAYLILNESIAQDSVGYGSMGILLISAVIGVLLAAGLVKRRRVQVCSLTGAGYLLMLVIMNALIFGGHYAGLGATAVLITISVLIGIFTGLGGAKRAKGHHKNKVYG